MITEKTETPDIVTLDRWLAPFEGQIRHRETLAQSFAERCTRGKLSLSEFSLAHMFFGLHRTPSGWVFRERAPSASRITLLGDFSGWKESSEFDLEPLGNGEWELVLAAGKLSHGDHYKMRIFWHDHEGEHSGDRIPAFARRVVQDPKTNLFSAQVWNPPEPYRWKNESFVLPRRSPLIYEVHIGMAQEEPRVGTYKEFTQNVLPRIAASGYNSIQIMAIPEHPYYGSFGYQVSSFFAPSSRFGTPEDLKELVDRAHEYGLGVIMDLVHSHAVKNENEGLSRIDGSLNLYFHSGERGEHPAWNTRLFDYGKTETLHFLLSNCRYWLDEFKFDGFRFDGVTSMIYRDHGLGSGFSSYEAYFNGNVDEDAIAYLSLANDVIHEIRPDAITIAEDVSGMPGLAAPREHGGVGFDYRLAMGVPDYWIKLIKHLADEQWNVSEMWWELTNRRADECTIGYAESHDQALVGDKTIIFRLADQEMYWHMQVDDSNLQIDRALALHKMIRLFTLATAGHGYLNFMGNEFGHPEWIDFPREGNAWSYHYARRQWKLRDDPKLKYRFLSLFDEAMLKITNESNLLGSEWPYKHYEHVDDCVIAFSRAGLYFAFNFHPTNSYSNRLLPAPSGGYRIVLNSDSKNFGGFGRVDESLTYTSSEQGIVLYLPARSVLVLKA